MNLVGRLNQSQGNLTLLSAEQVSLRVQDIQEAVNALFITNVGEAVGFLQGKYQGVLRFNLLADSVAHSQGVAHLAESLLDGAFVFGQDEFLLGLADAVA